MKYAVEEVLSPRHQLVGGYIILSDINLTGLPGSINYEGTKLVRKNEFHITIISTTKIAQLIDAHNQGKIRDEIIDEFQNFLRDNKLDHFKLKNEFRFVSRDTRKTIVVMCDFPDGQELFKRLEKRLGKTLPRQPFHITIFSLEPEVGISISSTKELQETKQISLAKLQAIRVE